MEDILGLILVFLFYAAAAALGGKKKKHTNRRVSDAERLRRYAQENAQRAGRSDVDHPAASVDMRTDMEKVLRSEGGETFCHGTKRMHLHEVASDELETAGEGEDPCHAGGEDVFAERVMSGRNGGEEPDTSGNAGFRQELARDVLRGVIMSEILTRPCERRATYRNGRGANG